MSPAEIITAASGSTVVGSVITWLLTRGIVKRKQDHAERADARADWARFTGEMRQALEAERRSALAQAKESQERHAASQHRIDDMQKRLDAADVRYRVSSDHIDMLEAHIWAQKPPPPPARPQGI